LPAVDLPTIPFDVYKPDVKQNVKFYLIASVKQNVKFYLIASVKQNVKFYLIASVKQNITSLHFKFLLN
jgi:hypothetical protein